VNNAAIIFCILSDDKHMSTGSGQWTEREFKSSIPSAGRWWIKAVWWGRLNAGVLGWKFATFDAKRCQLSSIAIYHTERAPCLFAAHLPWYSALRAFVNDSWSLLL